MFNAYLLALISGTQGKTFVHLQAQHMRDAPRPHLLKNAAVSRVPEGFTTVSQEIQDNAKTFLNRQERRKPFVEIAAAQCSDRDAASSDKKADRTRMRLPVCLRVA